MAPCDPPSHCEAKYCLRHSPRHRFHPSSIINHRHHSSPHHTQTQGTQSIMKQSCKNYVKLESCDVHCTAYGISFNVSMFQVSSFKFQSVQLLLSLCVCKCKLLPIKSKVFVKCKCKYMYTGQMSNVKYPGTRYYIEISATGFLRFYFRVCITLHYV